MTNDNKKNFYQHSRQNNMNKQNTPSHYYSKRLEAANKEIREKELKIKCMIFLFLSFIVLCLMFGCISVSHQNAKEDDTDIMLNQNVNDIAADENQINAKQDITENVPNHVETTEKPPEGEPNNNDITETTTTSLDNSEILIIGDSLTAGMQEYEILNDDTLPNATIDAVIGRNVLKGKEIYQDYVSQGWDGDIVIFELGTNGDISENQLIDMLSAVANDKQIILINTFTVWENGDKNNVIYDNVYQSGIFSNLYLADWYAIGSQHPEYMEPDGTHLNYVGSQAYLQLFEDSLDACSEQ